MDEDKVIFAPGPLLRKVMNVIAREIDKMNSVRMQEEKETPYILSANEIKFMGRFGWDIRGMSKAIKRDIQTGKVLAHEGDETWVRDLKVAGE